MRADNVDETTADFRSKGVEFMGEPKQARHGYGRLSNFLDPEGVQIEIVDRKDVREL